MIRPLAKSRWRLRSQRAGTPAGFSIGLKADRPTDVLRQIDAGFPVEAFHRLQQTSGLDADSLAAAMQLAPRTLARRKIEGRFHSDESERLFRLSRLFEQAVTLFENDISAARKWLLAPQRALNGATPLDYARTEIGAREVENLIGRLEHGIIA